MVMSPDDVDPDATGPHDLVRHAVSKGLSPAEGWALTLKEWLFLFAAKPAARLDRQGLHELMARFPDGVPKPAFPPSRR